MNELFKLGTVVRIQDVSDELMIIGYFPIDTENKRIYAYLGVNAAFGITFSDSSVFFDHDSITEIVFDGFSDEESDDFRSKIMNLKSYNINASE